MKNSEAESKLPEGGASTLSPGIGLLRELKRKYRALYKEKVVHHPDGSASFHQARLFQRGGIWVLSIKGDAFEMGYQHGRLLSEQVKAGVLFKLGEIIPKLIHQAVTKNPLVHKMLLKVLQALGNNILKTHIPPQYFIESFALSEGSGLALDKISDALLSMEALYILAKMAVKSDGMQISPMAFSGCSSFVAWGPQTTDGQMVIGRNLDYPLNGYYDAHPLVIYANPTDGGQRYCSFTTAGLNPPSMTAYNESGIFLAAHIVPTQETAFSGTPMYFIAAEVVKRARTFDEAVAIFRTYSTTTGWSYLLVSTAEKRVGAVEMTRERVTVRESRTSPHLQTNHFLCPEMQSSNMYINHSVDTDSQGRYHQMEARLREAPVSARTAPSLLGDQWDPVEKRERGLGNTVGVHLTLGSVVLAPSQKKVYVASGKGPVVHNDYIEFPWLDSFDPEHFDAGTFERIPGAPFSQKNPGPAQAMQIYIKAKMAFEYEGDIPAAYTYMQQVVALDPDNNAYRFVLAIFALKQDRFDEAVQIFQRLFSADHTEQIRNLSHYYCGRVFAHQAKRQEAMEQFDIVESSQADARLKQAAHHARNLVRVFGSHKLRPDRITLMMQFADMVSY